MVGTSRSLTNVNTMSYVKSWGQTWAAGKNPSRGASEALDLVASTSANGSIMCSTTTASNRCLKLNATPGTAVIANTKNVYLSVSLWSVTGSAAAKTSTEYHTANS
jgi:hypothetical protein